MSIFENLKKLLEQFLKIVPFSVKFPKFLSIAKENKSLVFTTGEFIIFLKKNIKRNLCGYEIAFLA